MNKKYYIYLALFNNLPFDVQVEKVLLSFDEFEINDLCHLIATQTNTTLHPQSPENINSLLIF